MNKHIWNYRDSFKFKKEHWRTLLIDAGFLGVMFTVISFFGNLIKKKAEMLSQGQTAEQLPQMLLNMQTVESEVFLASMQSFVITFIIGIVVILVGGLLLYSLTRKLIWDYLLQKKFNKKTYWRWNLLNLALIIPAIFYFLAFGFINLSLGYLFAKLNSQAILSAFYGLANLFLLFILVVFIFLVYYNFAKDYKVWESVGKAFSLIKEKWNKIGTMFLFILGTAVILSLVLWPLGNLLSGKPTALFSINAIISLFFLAWMRIYIFRTIER
jgi:hypothetical protein